MDGLPLRKLLWQVLLFILEDLVDFLIGQPGLGLDEAVQEACSTEGAVLGVGEIDGFGIARLIRLQRADVIAEHLR